MRQQILYIQILYIQIRILRIVNETISGVISSDYIKVLFRGNQIIPHIVFK